MGLRRFIEDIVCNRFGGFLAFRPPPLYASILFDPLAKGGFNAGVLNGYLRCIALAMGLLDHVTRRPARRMPFDKLSVFLKPYPVDSLGAPALALGGLMGVFSPHRKPDLVCKQAVLGAECGFVPKDALHLSGPCGAEYYVLPFKHGSKVQEGCELVVDPP